MYVLAEEVPAKEVEMMRTEKRERGQRENWMKISEEAMNDAGMIGTSYYSNKDGGF